MEFPGIEYRSEYEESPYNVEEVIKATKIKLTKNGGWYNGLCPFHKDSNPSFGINIKTGLCNCFSCGSKSLEAFVGTVLDIDSNEDILKWLKPFLKHSEDVDFDVLSNKLLSIDIANKRAEQTFDDFNLGFAIWVRTIGIPKFGFTVINNLTKIYDNFIHNENFDKAEELGDYIMNQMEKRS